jgi:predicted O-methyltransferase YrrM
VTNLTKNQSNLVDKVKKFETWLRNNKTLNANIIDMDDGIAVIKKV